MSSRNKQAKKAKQPNNLQQYYADDMIEDENEAPEPRQRARGATAMDEEENEEEEQNYTIEGDQAKDKLKKENMDKISDILVSLIFKNKVNSKNAFDVPLPDVEKLTDFHQATGDNSWKKLSQTLDAGAKIYGFRVDSVHNEAYRVLGGLNRTELQAAEEQTQENDKRDDDDHDTQDQIVRRHKKDTNGENTLEKNMHNIDTNKYDLEFDIDPLFQKTSAKFDEGGAKGLLLNNLCINEQLNLMFDSGNIFDLAITESQQHKKAHITKGFFKDTSLPSDILKLKLCPEVTTFKQTYLKDSKEFNLADTQSDQIFSQMRAEKSTAELKFENIDVDADQILNDLGAIVDGEFNEPQPLDNYQFQGDDVQIAPNAGLATNENSNTQGFFEQKDDNFKELNFNSIEERLANLGFGQALNALEPDSRSWMDPHLWKNKLKDKIKPKDDEKKQKREPKTKKKEQVPVDFNMAVKENWKDVFGIVSTARRKLDKKSPHKSQSTEQPGIKQAYLLPLDMQIKPSRLVNLFSRGLHQSRGGAGADRDDTGEIKEDYDFMNATIDNIPGDQIDPDTQDEIQQNLSNIFSAANRTEMQFDRPERFINIKVLKEKMWGFLEHKLPTISANDQEYDDLGDEEGMDEVIQKSKKKSSKKGKKDKNAADDELTFTDVCKQLPDMVDDPKNRGISVHSCFVTILHLANEQGLRFKKEPQDFKIFKEV